MIRKLFGVILIAIPFVFCFWITALEKGWQVATMLWGGSLLMGGLIYAGATLLTDD